MNRTGIEYGELSWNFYPGCLKLCSYCWAQKSLKWMKCPECRTGKPHFHPERMNAPIHRTKPTRILVNFTGDLFGDWVEDWVIREAMTVMKCCSQHTFLTLTKFPQNLQEFSPFPDNCQVGSSATTLEQYRAAIVGLAAVEAKVKFISFEPLLEHIPVIPPYTLDGISWIVIGGQTKPTVMPKLEWVQEILVVASKADIPVFLKDNLNPLFSSGLRQEFELLFDAEFKLRQELPG